MNLKKASLLALSAILVLMMGYFYLSPTPHFGVGISLRSEMPRFIEVSVGANQMAITNEDSCVEIVKALRSARGGGPPHACPLISTILLMYADGTTNKLYMMPGHHFTRTDLATDGRCYSMSTSRLFTTLEKAGLLISHQ